ncbi:hypothetical protein PENTCL1PPCAC_5203 [Pristionchus entomophagus]|uniref:Uncharacterized protein n=1 Tax=Pristionchus entomophagus TaxID=358040 RepID=A0AAV5SK87_9BILA|nr:hypothetical protein PENTCL1PPCAC_5202 [Pristionchus entomophagus]GMS83028.1 hypothetical protein PENTCL1PPCAC_5203 [Pristionchus entomophagus]
MISTLLFTSLLLSAASALKCSHNATVVNDVFQRGVLITSSTSRYEFGVMGCSWNLNRCVSFKAMDMSFFRTLDVGRDLSPFANMLRSSEGKVTGRSCMSQADAERIFAQTAARCTSTMARSCSCATDNCN